MTTLQHCMPLEVGNGPIEVTIVCTEGPGAVDVTGPDGEPVYGSVPVPTPPPPDNRVNVGMPGPVFVHYKRDAGGPDQIDVNIS